MPTKPLYDVPAKPRGLESISIDRTRLITLLKRERTRQKAEQVIRIKNHKKVIIDILSDYLKEARNDGINFEKLRRRYSDPAIVLPEPPSIDTCRYDHIIHRLSEDGRETIVLGQKEWDSLFPCEGVEV